MCNCTCQPETLNLDAVAARIIADNSIDARWAHTGNKAAHLALAGKVYGAVAGLTSFAQAQDAVTRAIADALGAPYPRPLPAGH